MLFFVISELADVEPMYQYSLAWFVGLFEATLIHAEKARELHKRIDNLMSHFQYSLYLKVRPLLTAASVRSFCCVWHVPCMHVLSQDGHGQSMFLMSKRCKLAVVDA